MIIDILTFCKRKSRRIAFSGPTCGSSPNSQEKIGNPFIANTILKNGLSFLGSDFSGLSETRYQGWFVGAGVAYGYAWILGRHWNLEAEIGFGYAYTRYDRYRCAGCGRKVESDKSHHYVGPTKAAVNLVYLF